MVREIKDYKEFQEIIAADNLTIIDFYADWCGPCKVIAPKFEELAEATEGVTFAKVNVEKVKKAAEFAKVKAMPTFKCYKDNKEIKEIVGANMAGIKKVIEAHKEEA